MKNKLILGFLIICIASIVVLIINNYYSKQASTKDFSHVEENGLSTFDTEIPKNASFIDSSKSDNFIYKASIKVNSLKNPDSKNISLIYDIKVTPKTGIVYKDIIATAFIDKVVWDIIAVKSYFCFGTDKDKRQLMDINSKSNKGIIFGRTTWLNPGIDYKSKEVQDKLKSIIKVKISFNNEVEYANILPSDTELIIIDCLS